MNPFTSVNFNVTKIESLVNEPVVKVCDTIFPVALLPSLKVQSYCLIVVSAILDSPLNFKVTGKQTEVTIVSLFVALLLIEATYFGVRSKILISILEVSTQLFWFLAIILIV